MTDTAEIRSDGEGEQVVYGADSDSDRVLFLPKTTFDWLCGVMQALDSSTWGELRRKMAAVGEEISAETGWYDEEEPAPEDDEPFDPDQAPGYADGDWPAMPEQYMADWISEEIADQFGEDVTTVFNGDYLAIKVCDIENVAEALRRIGYVCVRDDKAIAATFRL